MWKVALGTTLITAGLLAIAALITWSVDNGYGIIAFIVFVWCLIFTVGMAARQGRKDGQVKKSS